MALNGNLYLFQYLYEKINILTSIDINIIDCEESTPLILAIKNKRKDFVKYLLSLP